ncbi:MFS transporter [Acetobacteraceae bacterium KSS8]|uniref:MFS transporter n=1 Tax=Endosaccharibacter trunci TaxID=2812733 RepID=A0ABT1W3M9_9PROT|nr:MFS transporter [Acetobacteraceae bacterium KSS8]
MPLLLSRRLLPLLMTQMLGAVVDNLFKNALVVLVLFRAGQGGAPMLVALAGGLFILHYVLFSSLAGQVAERWDKGRLILLAKTCEIALMALAAAGFLLHMVPLLFAVLFGLGTQAAFFGPLKYGILPFHLRETELVAGNGLMEAGTFLGILFGTLAGSALFALPHGPRIVSVAGFVLSACGILAAAFVPRAPSRTPDRPVRLAVARESARLLRDARANRPVWLAILGVSWFWAIGAAILTELPTLVHDTLHAVPGVFSMMLAVFAVGTGLGSILCARLLHGRVTPRIVPFAALALTVFLFDFGRTAARAGPLADIGLVLHSASGWHMLIDLLLLSIGGGLYSVPLYAMMQERSGATEKARMVAANNLLNAAAMVASALAVAVLIRHGDTPASILCIWAIANLAVALWIGSATRRFPA